MIIYSKGNSKEASCNTDRYISKEKEKYREFSDDRFNVNFDRDTRDIYFFPSIGLRFVDSPAIDRYSFPRYRVIDVSCDIIRQFSFSYFRVAFLSLSLKPFLPLLRVDKPSFRFREEDKDMLENLIRSI